MKKQKLIWLLVLVLVCAIFFNSVAYAGPIDITDSKYKDAIDKLHTFGIVTSYDDEGNFKPEKEITRAEFIIMIIRALNLEESAKSFVGETAFSDITDAHWAFGYIMVAKQLGIIENGNMVYPDSFIKYVDAVKVLVKLLGYEYMANIYGANDVGYLRIASNLKLTKKIALSAGEFMSREVAAQLISNAIETDIAEPTEYNTNGQIAIGAVSGVTLLSKYRNVYKENGTVEGNEVTQLSGKAAVGEGLVKINGNIYHAGNTNARDYLGYNVDYYYEDANGIYTLVYIEMSDKNNDILTVTHDNIIDSTTNTTFEYYENNRKETVKIAPNANVIHNGVYMCKAVNIDEKYLKPESGKVVLIDNNDDSKYETIMITAYSTYVVDACYPSNLVIYSKNENKTLNLEVSGKEAKYYIKKDGKEISLSDIKEWDVLSVEKSNNATDVIYIINVCSDKVYGNIDACTDEGVFFSDVEYKYSKSYLKSKEQIISPGTKATLYFDVNGEIAWSEEEISKDVQYGYLVAAGKKGVLRPEVQLKIFNSSEKFEIFTCSEKIKLDGRNKDDAEEILTELSSSGVNEKNDGIPGVCQLIKYQLNDEKQIIMIDTVKENKNPVETDLTRSYTQDSRVSQSAVGMFASIQNVDNGRFYIDDSTIVFDVPQDKTKEKEFAIRGRKYFLVDKYYDIEAYDVVDLGPAKACLVSIGGTDASSIDEANDSTGMVGKIVGTRNSDGEDCYRITIYYKSKREEFFFTEDTKVLILGDEVKNGTLADITPGSSVFIKFNSTNDLSIIAKAFPVTTDPDTGEIIPIDELTSYTYKLGGYYERVFGYVANRKGKAIELVTDAGRLLYLTTDTPIYKYNFTYKEASLATLDDLIYSEVESEASKIFVRSRNGHVYQVIIYEW